LIDNVTAEAGDSLPPTPTEGEQPELGTPSTARALVALSPRELERHAPNYAAMVQAIEQCVSVDEVADIGDKAIAAQVYYHQSRDLENEILCSRIRLWAERHLGEVLDEMSRSGERSRGGKPSRGATVTTLAELGIPRDRASRAQQLAAVPEVLFKDVLSQHRIASPRGILRELRPRADAEEEASDSLDVTADDAAPSPSPTAVNEEEFDQRVKEEVRAAVTKLLDFVQITSEDLALVITAIESSDAPERARAIRVVNRIAIVLDALQAGEPGAVDATNTPAEDAADTAEGSAATEV
jgi:hypothetical protein